METLTSTPPRRRVRVWFGERVIVDHVTDPESAARFEGAMRRRFASLRVTNEPLAVSDADL